MAASISMVDITEDQIKFPDFIGSFMPDKVPKVPDDFFYDGTIQQLIINTDNENKATMSATINIITQEVVDEFISRDIMLAGYPNYRKLNLLLAGLVDIINYKDNVNIDDDNIYYYKDEFDNIVNKALMNVTKYNTTTANNNQNETVENETVENETAENEAALTDIEVTDDLKYMIDKTEEIISLFKLFYNDTDYKTTIYDNVIANQAALGKNQKILDKLSALSNVAQTTDGEQAIINSMNKEFNAAEAGGGADTGAGGGATGRGSHEEDNNNTGGFFGRSYNENLGGGYKKNKTYRRTVKRSKRSKRSKSKRRSQ